MFKRLVNFVVGIVDMVERATLGPDIYDGVIDGDVVYPVDKLIGKKGYEIFTKMLTDDQVKPALLLQKYSVAASGWDIKPASEETSDIEKAEFIKFVFEQMKGSIDSAILEILTAKDYGFSVSEINWMISEVAPYIDKIIIKNIKAKHPADFEFEVDEFGNILQNGIIQISTGTNLDKDKFILYSHNAQFGDVYGISDLRAAYKPWFCKTTLLKAWSIYLERFATPTPVAKYTTRAKGDGKDDLRKILNNLQSKTSIVIPKKLVDELSFLEVSGQGGDAFQKAITYFDKAISRSMLLPDQMGLGGKENTGSNAKARTHLDVFYLSIQKIRKDVAGLIKEALIKPLIDMNYGFTEKYPELTFNPIIAKDKHEIAKIWVEAATKGVVKLTLDDENAFRQMLDMPERKADKELADIAVKEDGKSPEREEDKKESDEKEKKFSDNGFSRALNLYEEKENFTDIKNRLVKQENNFIRNVGEIIEKQKADLIKTVKRLFPNKSKFNTNFVKTLSLQFNNETRTNIFDSLKDAFTDGSETGKKLFVVPITEPLPPAEALAYFRDKSFYITGVIDEDIKKQAKQVLFTSIKEGWSVNEIAKELDKLFIPYLGDAGKIIKDKITAPYRLETIARTNISEVFNQGRKAAFEPEVETGFIIGYEYSSILDDRTTDICNFLDEKIFDPKNSVTARLIPPNHFNERAVIVPVTRDEGPITYITQSEIDRALKMKAELKFN